MINPTRREAIQAAAASVVTLAAARAHAAEAPAVEMPPIDYGRSFICSTAPFNAVRFWVESRTRIIDSQSNTSTDYYQCASCKSENTFAERDLFMKDNYDFLPILGKDRWLVFRRTVRLSDRYRTIKTTAEMWGEPILKLVDAQEVTVLDTWEQIRDATAAALPLVTQTEIANAESGLRAIIECPTKTMNISLEKGLYQVDTGPVAFPDLASRRDLEIECLSLAFVAFNAPDFADFVIEQPTRVSEETGPDCQVYHYSNPVSFAAKNRVLALGRL
ncbi:MAG: hypothetical protein IT364_12030 [Candidatus Hydrogenedentes bacterium]|nr:hypothetical protein [Candidatus Hydrogenedentota bacterium]